MLFKRKCKITFIAHGATIYTEENRICDKESHPPLNEIGQEEAERIAKWIVLRSPQVDKIYTGASLSCIQTANYVAKEYGQEFEIRPELKNQEFGIWKGLNYQEIEERYPEMLDKYHELTSSYAPEGAELDLGQDVYDYVCTALPLKRVHPDGGCNQETVGYLSE